MDRDPHELALLGEELDAYEVALTAIEAARASLEAHERKAHGLWLVVSTRAKRLGFTVAPPPAAVTTETMTLAEYAKHASISERTVRNYLQEWKLGVHFTREGLKGRKVSIIVAAADEWRRGRTITASNSIPVIDEVTRYRAKAALRRLGGGK